MVTTTVTMTNSAMKPRTAKPMISAIVTKIDVKNDDTNNDMDESFERVNLEKVG